MKYFVNSNGANILCQLDAFLAYWLNYFVFPSPSEDGMHVSVFLVAVRLAQGKRVAPTP